VVFSGGEQNVETVMVAGRVIMDQGKLTQIDEAGLLFKAQKAARNLVMRANII
jgi:cytosine/adenosine deaminase-related metal-dependent hydrolase